MLTLLVPLPVLPVPPEAYSISVVSILAAVVGAVGLIGFAVVSLTFTRLLQRGGAPWVLMGLTLVLLVGGLGGAYLTSTAGERAASDASREYRSVERAARVESIGQLEGAYGVTFEDSAVIPMTPDDYSYAQPLTFTDGHAEDCFVLALAQGYEIRCGGATAQTATPLPPAS